MSRKLKGKTQNGESSLAALAPDQAAKLIEAVKSAAAPTGVSRAAERSVVMDLDEVVPPGEVIELATACVRFVTARFKIDLDFERETLPVVDHYVAEARDSLKKRPETVALTAHSIGAYLGEVVRRCHACWWRVDFNDPGAWRLEFRNVYLSFYPVQVAHAALNEKEPENHFSGFEMADEDREALASRLSDLPDVSADEYRAPSTWLEVLDIAVDALLAKRAHDPAPVRPYGPDDYAG